MHWITGWFVTALAPMIRTAPPTVAFCGVFLRRLPAVAVHAPSLAIGHVVPCPTLADRHDVIRVHLSSMCHTLTVNALPVALIQHSLTPQPVGFVAVASSSCVGPARLITAHRCFNAWWPKSWNACWHAYNLYATQQSLADATSPQERTTPLPCTVAEFGMQPTPCRRRRCLGRCHRTRRPPAFRERQTARSRTPLASPPTALFSA